MYKVRNTHRSNQWASDVRDHGPIESEDAHSETAHRAEELVDDNIIGCDPANPAEGTQRSEKIARYPVPTKAARQRDAEELFPRNMVPVLLPVTLMQCVE